MSQHLILTDESMDGTMLEFNNLLVDEQTGLETMREIIAVDKANSHLNVNQRQSNQIEQRQSLNQRLT